MAIDKLLFSSLYDLADTAYRYGVYSDPINSPKYLKTTGSSTTVAELNTTDDTFAGFGAGDLIHVNVDGTVTTRIVTATGSVPDSVTVNSAVDWQNGTAGRAFSFRRWQNGTAATDGWFRVAEFDDKSVSVRYTTKNAASMDVIIQGRLNGGALITLYTKNYTAATDGTLGSGDVFKIVELVDEIRVGAQITTDSAANNVEISFKGERFGR